MVQMTHEKVETVAAIQALNGSIQSLDLFGRTVEQGQLGAIYQQFKEQQSDGPSQLVLIHGASGTGKSALVEHAVRKSSERDGVYCITGGFDQLMHVQQPHAAFVDALTSLVQLVKERNQMNLFRRLTQQLEEMDVLVKMIPAIADAMKSEEGPKMEAELSNVNVTTLLGSHNSKEMASRFKYAILQFVRAIASGMGQIVLVLEDIYRADESALDLLSSLLCDSVNRSILFVATYRDESNAEVLDTFLKKLPSQGTTMTHIPLQNLDSASAADMIKSLLQIDRWWMYDNALVDFVLKQTKGNPYFILMCLRTLAEECLLRYNPSSIPPWQCDSEELQIEFGETILDILRRKIAALPPMAFQALRFASFLGSKVNLEIVSHLVGETEAVVVSYLNVAADNGLLVHHETRGWSFSHDSIQDAIMNVVPENEREEQYNGDGCDALIFIFAQFYVMQLSFVFGDIENAFRSSKNIRVVSTYPFGGLDASFIAFFDGLVAINYVRKVKKRQNLKYGIQKIRQFQEWAKHSPEQFLCRQSLLEAEMAAVNGDPTAHSKYISSIAQARYAGCILVTALANELTGKYFLQEKNEKDVASTFIQEALRTYEDWGAKAKVEHLSNEWSLISQGYAAK
jgi:AAA ATPase domain